MANIRAAQVAVEALVSASANQRAAQAAIEALVNVTAAQRVAQTAIEALINIATHERAAQFCLEYILWEMPPIMPAIYPELIGLTFSVIKRPIFYTSNATSASGYNNRVSYSNTPTWEWELTYEYLPDPAPVTTTLGGVTSTTFPASDLKVLLGFYLAMQGDMIPFLFRDPDDYLAYHQPIAIGDGLATNFTFVRTYGQGETGTEPVGWVKADTVKVYIDGALQDPGSYDIDQTFPVKNQIRFHGSPGSGAVITADFEYYYFVKFKDTRNDFEKFLSQLWAVKKVTLMSLRG